MTTQVGIFDEYGRNSMRKLVVHDTEHPGMEARLALVLIERWGMVAGEPDGEDSTGRAKLKLSTPEQVIDRACSTAALALEAFRARGWMVDGPDIAELHKADD